MRRHDLPSDKQDWQIIDSTPVQMCDGKISFLFSSLLLSVFNQII